MQKISIYKRIAYIIYGIVLIVAIFLVSWQLYQISSGKVPSAIPLESVPVKDRVPGKAFAKVTKISDSPEVKEILAMQPVNVAELKGDNKRVIFRSSGGELLCTIAKQLEKNPPELLPLTVNSKGDFASGEGVICASVHRQKASDIVGKCKEGEIRNFSIGLWDNQVSLGVCTGQWPPLTKDAIDNQKDNNSGKRLEYSILGVNQYTKLGKYGCMMQGAKVTCANLETGKGFEYSDIYGYKVF